MTTGFGGWKLKRHIIVIFIVVVVLLTVFKMVTCCHTAWTFGLIKQYYVDNFTAFEFYVSSRDPQHGSAMIVEP